MQFFNLFQFYSTFDTIILDLIRVPIAYLRIGVRLGLAAIEDTVFDHVMYQVHGPSHLAENGVSVLPGRRTLGMPKAGFAGREQHHGTPLQNLASRCHLRPSPLVFQVILKFPNVPSIHS